MRIKDWVIECDPLNWVLSEVKVYGPEAKKNKPGEEYTVVKGYYGSLDALVRAITDEQIKKEWESIRNFKQGVEGSLKELIQND